MPVFYSRNFCLYRKKPDILSSGGGNAFPIAIVAGSPYAQISSSLATTYSVNLAGVQYTQGDMIIVFFTAGKNGDITIPAGWTQVIQTNYGGVITSVVAYKFAGAGTESNPTFTSTITCYYSSHVWVVRGAALQIEAVASSNSSGVSDPPALTPSGGLKDYIFFAFRAGDFSIAALTTAGPDGYSGFITTEPAAASTDGAATSTCWKQVTTTTEDPGPFTNGSEQWTATTVGIWSNG